VVCAELLIRMDPNDVRSVVVIGNISVSIIYIVWGSKNVFTESTLMISVCAYGYGTHVCMRAFLFLLPQKENCGCCDDDW
jgi:hypothetical protein